MADLGAGHACLPHVGEELAERLALLARDHPRARVAAEDLLAGEAGGALARLVEQQDPALAVEHAHERLGRLGEDPGERVAEDELGGLGTLHARSLERQGRASRSIVPSMSP
jgi:hypothetical protein